MARQKATRETLPPLPVLAVAPALRGALRSGHVVLTAEPGSGKTTLVPLLLRDEPWLAGRKIVMLEPRRPAARMAARRMADLLGESIGGTVGYQVRFERVVSSRTRIEVVTEGLLLRRLQDDPELGDVGLLVFDEFHERNLVSDLSLALTLDVTRSLRDDLRVLVMSASLDAAPLARLLGAEVISAAGQCHAVEIHRAERDLDVRDPVPACLRLLEQALSRSPADVLVFLPGRREIERMRSEAGLRWGKQVDVQTLYGEMTAAEQDRVLQGRGDRRRVIIATDIAETSLTIEGVHAVVDSGLARRPTFDPNTGLSRLETQWISRASALQRAGRAGRLAPGWCWRAWTAAREARLAEWTPAEIVDADLAPMALELAAWGVADPAQLSWLDPPSAAHWQQAVDLLSQLQALDGQGRITGLGRRMVRLPMHPRLAHMLVVSANGRERRLAADVAALLSERDPLRRAADRQSADLDLRLGALDAFRATRRPPAGADRDALRRVDKAAQQYLALSAAGADDAAGAASDLDAGACVALAFPERIAMCTSTDGRRYLLRNGRAALLDERDPLRGTPFLAVAAVDAGRRDGIIWLAAPLDARRLEQLFGAQVRSEREVRWDAALGDVVARATRRLGALLLRDEAVALRPEDPVAEVLAGQVRRDGLAAFFDDPVDLRARVVLARRIDPDGGWPDFSEQALLQSVADWLPPWLKDGEGARQLRRLDLREILLGDLGWERRQQLDAWLPTHFDSPAGTRRRIDYPLDGDPFLAIPLQEVLGLQAGPVLAGGRMPLLLHLLSPAGRPLQVTRDLAAFWMGAYDEVKKEMRGRYPKHFWPDDPASAQATRFTKRRM